MKLVVRLKRPHSRRLTGNVLSGYLIVKIKRPPMYLTYSKCTKYATGVPSIFLLTILMLWPFKTSRKPKLTHPPAHFFQETNKKIASKSAPINNGPASIPRPIPSHPVSSRHFTTLDIQKMKRNTPQYQISRRERREDRFPEAPP